jgi:hypothetical protein
MSIICLPHALFGKFGDRPVDGQQLNGLGLGLGGKLFSWITDIKECFLRLLDPKI